MAKNNRSKLPFPYVADPDEDATYITIASPRTRDGEPLFTPKETVLLFFAAILVDDLVEYDWIEALSLINNSVETGNLYAEHGSRLANIFATSAAATWLAGDHEFHHIVEEEHKDSQLHAILELKMMECAYKILNNPIPIETVKTDTCSSTVLLQGKFATAEERLQEIERLGVIIDGSNPPLSNAKLQVEMNELQSNNSISYVNELGEKQVISWIEGGVERADLPWSVSIEHPVSGLSVAHIHDNHLDIAFLNKVENCTLRDISMANLNFSTGQGSRLSGASELKLQHLEITTLNLGPGLVFDACEFHNLNISYLLQDPDSRYDIDTFDEFTIRNPSVPYDADLATRSIGDRPVTFNNCNLYAIEVTHPEKTTTGSDPYWDEWSAEPINDIIAGYLNNWVFYGGSCRSVTLPRSYLPTTYVFNDTNIAKVQFVLPDLKNRHTDGAGNIVPRGKLSVEITNSNTNSNQPNYTVLDTLNISIPAKPENGDGLATIKLASAAESPEFSLTPSGHWNEIILDNVMFIGGIQINDKHTCDTITIEKINSISNGTVDRYLFTPWDAFFAGDTADPKRMRDLPVLDLSSKHTTNQYLSALLNAVITPENADEIKRITGGAPENENNETETETIAATKSKKPKP
jgi:hypothetical protein